MAFQQKCSATLARTQHWPSSLNGVTHSPGGRRALKINSLFVFCCFSGGTKGVTRPFICGFFQSFFFFGKKRGREEKKASLRDVSLHFFLPSWGAVCCLRSLYLPFISDSLTLLAGRVSGRQSLSPGPVMFLQITEGLWSRRSLLIAEASDGARAICQIDGKVAEWGPRHPLLIRYFLPFYVSHSGVAWKPHLCNLNPAGGRLKRRPTAGAQTQTHPRTGRG